MLKQDEINRAGLQMAHTIIATKPAFNAGDDCYICPFCESDEMLDGNNIVEKLEDISHNYGCVFLTAKLYRAELIDLYGITE